jgi:hypothetical protein
MKRRHVVGLGLVVGLALSPAVAQETSTSPGVLLVLGQAEGAAIEAVIVELGRSSGNETGDRAALAAAQRISVPIKSSRLGEAEIGQLLNRLEGEPSVSHARADLLPGSSPSAVRIKITVDAAQAGLMDIQPEGVLSGRFGDFPVLYKDDRTLLTAIVSGGVGIYSDTNSWFGQPQLFNQFSPIAGNLPGRSASWSEGSVELGAGLAARMGDTPLYAFGAITGTKTWSLGQDIFRDDDRNFDAIEKAFAGILYADPASKTKAKFSVGRQTFTLNDGFLVNMVKGSSNAGERGASYLGPRLSNDFSVLASASFGPWSLAGFYIDPNELEWLESDSTFLGFNAKYGFSDDLSVDLSYITILNSKSRFANPFGFELAREGLNTIAGHLKWTNLGFDGLWIEGEAAHQSSPVFDMSAWAAYGTAGYIARSLPWTPSLSYRYAYFSGDDPNTPRYERFDPLLSTGLGIWLQGVSFGKLTSNSNLATHRIQFNVAPTERLNVTFDYYKLEAPELNNLGSNPALATLTSHDLGQEISLSARWAINNKLFLQGVASHAMPGKALRDLGADENWSTFQLSLYWGL